MLKGKSDMSLEFDASLSIEMFESSGGISCFLSARYG
ncbi:unnamed protein product [Arabidopsis thaliana]|uniref:Uncharacterized protein n=1 Tax=Arabidopsis thaliana TaxID=3702 RepID=A0A5S9Y8U2_ARATH|nr:unnamed protein product [Arabidopsis thaliana]VYS68534.1 unnamed protein product [Arabidopsis thaliana]